jgi:DNA-binding IclR family transcriptional regulator
MRHTSRRQEDRVANQQIAVNHKAAARKTPRVGSVSATISILRLLASGEPPLGVNAIARRLKLTPSSCFNILKTMADEDFVHFDPVTKAYSLGGGVIAIARRALDPGSAFELIRARAEEFAQRRSVTIGLWRVERRRIVLVGYVPGATTMRIHLTVGQRLPLLMGAVGRCIAAVERLDDEALARGFAELRWQDPLPLAAYRAEVEETRRNGWGLDEGHFIRGVTTLAAPVLDATGSVSSCISATMFSGQYPPEAFPEVAEELRQIADWASGRLTGR